MPITQSKKLKYDKRARMQQQALELNKELHKQPNVPIPKTTQKKRPSASMQSKKKNNSHIVHSSISKASSNQNTIPVVPSGFDKKQVQNLFMSFYRD